MPWVLIYLMLTRNDIVIMSKTFTLKTTGKTNPSKTGLSTSMKFILPFFILSIVVITGYINLLFVPILLFVGVAAFGGYFLFNQSKVKQKESLKRTSLHAAMLDQDNTIQLLFNVTEESFSFLNENVFSLLGYDTEEKIAANNLFFLAKETELALRMKLHRNYIERHHKFSMPIDLIDSKGQSRHFIANVKAIFNDQNVIDDAFVSFIDVSESKEALILANERSEHLELVIQQYKDYQREMEQLSMVLNTHDLKEPIRNITSFSQLLNKRYGHQFDPFGREFMGYILKGATQLNDMVDDMGAFSTLSSNSMMLDKIDTLSLINSVTKRLKDKHHLDFKLEFDQLPNITADSTQIRYLFLNLIENAIKYRSEKDLVIKIDCLKKDKFWEFQISDNGIGIHDDYKDKIFNMFQRLHSVGKYSGTGIGLAICKKIADNHNGLIWLKSHGLGNGSTFCFTIPATQAEQNEFLETKVSDTEEELVGSRSF